MDEQIYTDYRVVTDNVNERCILYSLDGELLYNLSGWYFIGWIFNDSLFYKGYSLVGSFCESPYSSQLFQLETGIVSIPGLRVISSMCWRELMWAWMYDGYIGLLRFDLTWALPPEYDYITSPDVMHGLPYMECRKDEMWQIFIADGRMFPLHTGCVAEVLICDSFYKTEVCETTICVIKECNPDGRWRFVCLEVTGNEVSCIYESPFLYDERIEADDCYSVSYYENGVLKEFYIKE